MVALLYANRRFSEIKIKRAIPLKSATGWTLWHAPVVSATQEAEARTVACLIPAWATHLKYINK